uniref:Cyclin E1 n=1 Tax=Leptobrachium leishanense TaxID=445787 RepID=A0A8C5PQM8_9ANUR
MLTVPQTSLQGTQAKMASRNHAMDKSPKSHPIESTKREVEDHPKDSVENHHMEFIKREVENHPIEFIKREVESHPMEFIKREVENHPIEFIKREVESHPMEFIKREVESHPIKLKFIKREEESHSEESQQVENTARRKTAKKRPKKHRHRDGNFSGWIEGLHKRRERTERCIHELENNTRHSFLRFNEDDNRTPMSSSYYMGFLTPSSNPLPTISWADRNVLWRNMLEQDDRYYKDKTWLRRHPDITKRFRALMVDWLMEIAQNFKMQRETLYLAQDYFDRFMSVAVAVDEIDVQLVGITCLFIAAKYEEVIPPNLDEFALLTDGYLSKRAICKMELRILKALDWRMTSMTLIAWINFYIQNEYLVDEEELMTPRKPLYSYMEVAALLDLCVLDVECLQFPNRVLAAAVLYHFAGFQLVQKASGLTRTELSACIDWVVPFASAICDIFIDPNVRGEPAADDRCDLQTRTSALQLLNTVDYYKAEFAARLWVASRHPVQRPICHASEEHPQAPLHRAMLQMPSGPFDYFRSLLDGMDAPSLFREASEEQLDVQPQRYMSLMDVQPRRYMPLLDVQ